MDEQLLKQAVIRKLAYMQEFRPIMNALSFKQLRDYHAAMQQLANAGAMRGGAFSEGVKGMAGGLGKGLLGWGGMYLGARGLQNLADGDQQ